MRSTEGSLGQKAYLGAWSRTGSTGCKKTAARLCVWSFFRALRHALKSFRLIPAAWALGMFCGFFFSGTGAFLGGGSFGTENVSRLSSTGLAAALGARLETSPCTPLGGSLSFCVLAKGKVGVLVGGPPVLMDGRVFNLTGGIGGATSVTGVGGR